MSYEKQTWVNGEVITADKLNHMENGIGEGGGGTLVTNLITPAQGVFESDHTYAEMKAAFDGGQMIVLNNSNDIYYPCVVNTSKIVYVKLGVASNQGNDYWSVLGFEVDYKDNWTKIAQKFLTTQ